MTNVQFKTITMERFCTQNNKAVSADRPVSYSWLNSYGAQMFNSMRQLYNIHKQAFPVEIPVLCAL